MKNKFAATCKKCGKQVQAGAGETNMVDGKWHTEHATADACKSAVSPAPRRVGCGIGGYGGSEMWRDYWDEEDNPYGPFSTSEDVNPNEGSK